MVPVPIALFNASPSAVEVIVIAAKKLGTIWPLEPHTEAKHIILRRYLHAWVPILTSWNGRVVYIDGFAGPGVYTGGEDGSPIIALKAAIEHSARISGEMHFIFIEAHRERFEVLKQRVDEVARPANFKVLCQLGRFDETMTSLLDDLERERSNPAPTFAFVDPFGFSHTPISLIERIMTYPRCEVLITFMYEEINRFLSHADQPENYDQLFGTLEWRRALDINAPRERKIFLRDLYQTQLRERCRVEHVRSFEMLNDGNRTDYFLFFGTNNVAGLKKMKEAMWKVDEASGLQFSDATDPTQEVLFTPEPSFSELKRRIVKRFRGRQVAVSDVERFVVCETPYRETHFKRQVLKLMEQADPRELDVIGAPANRRKGTFPDGTVIRIL
jgi:three-Cys-motif partner protein